MPPQFREFAGLSLTRNLSLLYARSQKISENLCRDPLRFSITAFALLSALHLTIWVMVSLYKSLPFSLLLKNWDAGWYLGIVNSGYNEASSAFLPLFPYTVAFLKNMFALESDAAVLCTGALLSLSAFVFALFVMTRLHSSKAFLENRLALFLFVASPSAYVFHSFHTEGLFLLASVLAFRSFYRKELFLAAIFSGLAALTRHQGIFLAIALAACFDLEGVRFLSWHRLKNFVIFGLVSGSLWSLTALVHMSQGRSPFPWMGAHSDHWYVADGAASYFKTFVLANPIQNLGLGSLLRHAFTFAAFSATLQLALSKRFAEFYYCLLCLLVMPMQGEFVDIFRFSAVLFPVYNSFARTLQVLPKHLLFLVLTCYLTLNLAMSYAYALHRWAY